MTGDSRSFKSFVESFVESLREKVDLSLQMFVNECRNDLQFSTTKPRPHTSLHRKHNSLIKASQRTAIANKSRCPLIIPMREILADTGVNSGSDAPTISFHQIRHLPLFRIVLIITELIIWHFTTLDPQYLGPDRECAVPASLRTSDGCTLSGGLGRGDCD